MFPLLPALIILLLHGPSNFERLAETGRLPKALSVFHTEVAKRAAESELGREDASRRVLASLIAASGDRSLSAAFAHMFVTQDPRAARMATIGSEPAEPAETPLVEPPGALSAGLLKCVRSRDGPAKA